MARTITVLLFVALFVAVLAKKRIQLSDLMNILSDSSAYPQCTTDALNLRTSPSTGARIVRTLSKGTTVNVYSTNNGWAQVDGGYVSTQYLGNCAGATTQCTTDALNLRESPSTGARIIRTLPQGTRVTVLSTSNGWGRTAEGYLSTQFLGNCGSGPVPGPSSGGISSQQLRAIMPNLSQSRADQYLSYLNSGMREAGINNCPRISAFLAQLAHESGQLIYWEEIASGAAYEGRRDLGNTQPGDGVRYKGRGPIQLTGRANYRAAGQALNLPLEAQPKMVSETSVGFRTSLWYWNSRSLSNYADQNVSAF